MFMLASVLLAATLSLTCTSCGSPSFSKETQDKITAVVEADMKAADVPGAVVGVWQKGKGSYLMAFGESDVNAGTPMKTTDVFREASITKTYTAVEILTLVDSGKLSLDDTLSKWDFSEGLPNRDKVTVRMLLNHTSGYPDPSNDYPPFSSKIITEPEREWTPEELVQVAIQDNNYLPPGQEYRYSNFGYCLLGMIVKRITGKPLAEVLQADLMKPLSLDSTSFDNAAAFIKSKPHAVGYMPNIPTALGATVGGSEKNVDTTSWNTSWTWAAGSMCGNAPDLKKWIEADAGGKLLKPATVKLQQQTDAVPMGEGSPFKYGLGIATEPLADGSTLFWHNGAVPGYSSFAGSDPENGLTVVVLYNQFPTPDGDSTYATETAMRILGAMGFLKE